MGNWDPPLLETRYEFKKTEGSGFENQHWAVFYYENFRVFNAMNP